MTDNKPHLKMVEPSGADVQPRQISNEPPTLAQPEHSNPKA